MNTKNYFPVLKWKAAEKKALDFLKEETKKEVKPIIELVLPSNTKKEELKENGEKRTHEELHNISVDKFKENYSNTKKEIIGIWEENEIMFDTSLLHDQKNTVTLRSETMNNIANYSIIPVINLIDDIEIKETIKDLFKSNTISSVGVRFTYYDLIDVDILNKRLEELLKYLKISEEKITLILDLKFLDQELKENYTKIIKLSQQIVSITEWKELVLSSGSFPVDMSEFSKEEKNYIDRSDWIFWCKAKFTQRTWVFSDYTVRHPIYNHAVVKFQATASLKYTLENSWLILKGQRGKFEQYLAHAYILVNDPSDNEYRSPEFSYGDAYIKEKSEELKKLQNGDKYLSGSSTTWIRASVNLHIELAHYQNANLSLNSKK